MKNKNKKDITVTTAKLSLENGITIMVAGAIVDGEAEFYELAGVITEDNILEICEKFKEIFTDQREAMN